MTVDAGETRNSILQKLRRVTGGTSAFQRNFQSYSSSSVSRGTTGSRPGLISDGHIQQLETELRRLGGEFHSVPELKDVEATILQLAQDSSYHRIAVSNDDLLQEGDLVARLHDSGYFESIVSSQDDNSEENIKNALKRCHLGITGCDSVIAETATVVLSHRNFGGRSISLLPECHVVVAGRAQVLGSLDDWMDMQVFKTETFSSCLTFVTGPSRTADIEKVLVTGVHGPLRLILLLVG